MSAVSRQYSAEQLEFIFGRKSRLTANELRVMKTKSRGFDARALGSFALVSLVVTMIHIRTCHAQPGSLDVSFNPQTSLCSAVSLLELQADGKILYLASIPCMPFSSPQFGRLLPGGSVDSGFAT